LNDEVFEIEAIARRISKGLDDSEQRNFTGINYFEKPVGLVPQARGPRSQCDHLFIVGEPSSGKRSTNHILQQARKQLTLKPTPAGSNSVRRSDGVVGDGEAHLPNSGRDRSRVTCKIASGRRVELDRWRADTMIVRRTVADEQSRHGSISHQGRGNRRILEASVRAISAVLADRPARVIKRLSSRRATAVSKMGRLMTFPTRDEFLGISVACRPNPTAEPPARLWTPQPAPLIMRGLARIFATAFRRIGQHATRREIVWSDRLPGVWRAGARGGG
jgi:hypothetical protein